MTATLDDFRLPSLLVFGPLGTSSRGVCCSAMQPTPIAAVPLALLMLLGVAGCGDNGGNAVKKDAAAAAPPAAIPVPAAGTTLTPAPITLVRLDPELLESRECITVMSFYADALHAKLYGEAARVWGKDWGISAATLEMRYSAYQPVSLELGESSVEGGAGSLYCEVATVLKTTGRPPRTGTIILRRVNDVPGASADQLRWHITDSTFAEADERSGDDSSGR